MQERRAPPDRTIWLLLTLPCALLLLLALWLVLLLQRQAAGPPPLQQDSLRLSTWLLPGEFSSLYPVEYIGAPSAALAVSSASVAGSHSYGYYSYNPPDTLLRLTPAADGLALAEQRAYRLPQLPEQWTAEGAVLSLIRQSPVTALSGSAAATDARLDPLPDAPGAGGGQFDFGFESGAGWWYTLLDPQRIAVIQDPKAHAGVATLWIGKRGAVAEQRGQVEDAVALGDAWLGGNTLAVLARPDRLYLLDPAGEALLEVTQLRPLVAKALQATPDPYCIYYSGGCLLVLDGRRSKLRIYGLDGSTLELQQLDPYSQRPDGRPRPAPPRALAPWLPLFGSSPYAVSLHTMRRDGRLAPLTSYATTVGNICLPVGEGRFALFDDLYHRVVLIEYSGGGA